jgi:hypothetical protein
MTSGEPTIRSKIHVYGGRMILAICDSELLGKTLDNDGIPFVISESFYGGPLIGKEECLRLLSEVGNVNLVGFRSVQIAIEGGFAKEESVRTIAGIPHIQIYSVKDM